MSWSALITLLLQFFGPLLQKLLDDLLNRLTPPQSNIEAIDPPAGMAALFQAARDQTWWFQFRKRAQLAVAERIAVRRAPEFWRAMKFSQPAPALTLVEKEQIRDTL
ncbi:hypothetical protein VT84_14210 [Gemmata sp. SH-PL17]|uniref:hypothetical protein n=1 Tax=Gemmata sp. SH-PL17 TaxID=1630693 RepID=UPI00078DBC69|nr:hypothetical protein [Gemmata sp. SH-PL17]AMV25547.1 hypothetical protein VT84_14210 [Gemmata sp. SH-PL17]